MERKVLIASFMEAMNNALTSFMKDHRGLVDDGDMKFLSKLDTKLHTQMSLDKDRLAFVACIVKDCKHNRLGDMIVTIKDQSRIAKAGIHKKVLQDGQFGPNIGISSVMLLQDVFMFNICPPIEDIVKTSVSLLRNRLGEEVSMDDILKKLKPPLNEVSSSDPDYTSNATSSNDDN
ncbi:hypothetical protein DEO72_LG2g3797 [Vigna unguiculata]|uniref:Homologous recombination OB-fold protein OB-fold domain-containing protein n=1 Tax=Vigna unguiculata TaxID=3917 RepID=A0A4D6L4L7_VIGUN|nr:hypothetical protein DEO72_LG2g3797 [Vigna unguiculata]